MSFVRRLHQHQKGIRSAADKECIRDLPVLFTDAGQTRSMPRRRQNPFR
jgi:hypothetical protein